MVCTFATAHRREDVQDVVRLNHGAHPVVQIARIASVDEDVDVRIKIAGSIQHLALHRRKARRDGIDQLADRDTVIDIELDRFAPDNRAIGGVEVDFHH